MDNNFNSLVLLTESFSKINFFEKNHKYTIDNIPAKISVSSAIKKYEKEFEKDKIASNIARRDGKTINEVLTEWDMKAQYSCHKGTEFHLFVENFLERKKISLDKESLLTFMSSRMISDEEAFIENYYNEMAKIISNFINFYNWWKQDHILIKSEFVVGDEIGICGTIDNLSYNKITEKLVIFDYKTNKEIKRKNPWGQKLLEPFTHLHNCELVKYSIQIWLYKLILERNTPFEIDNGYIVWVSGEEYESIPILNLKDEASYILNNL